MSLRVIEPSLDTRPIIRRKTDPVLVTRTPWRWTSCGSLGSASWSLFWTWTCAMSGSVPASKVSVTCALPAESLEEAM
jgi:hypothetical protein